MKLKLAMSALAVAGLIGGAQAAPQVSGTAIGVDFGPTAPTNRFNQAGASTGTVAAGVLVDTSGTVVDGVSVTWSGGGWSNSDAATESQLPGQPAEFNESNLTDWIGVNAPAGLTITFAGLDDALSYTLLIGSGFVNNSTNVDTRWTVDSQIADTLHDIGKDAFVTFAGLSTDGSGNLVITGVKAPTQTPNNIAVISALLLKGVNPLPAVATWQTDGNGDWSIPGNWDPAAPNGVANRARFDGTLLTAPLAATLDAAATLGDLAFDSNHNITIDGGSALTFDNDGCESFLSATAGSHEISADVTLGGDLDASVAAGSSVEISGALAGTATVELAGDGDLILSGDLSGFAGGLISRGNGQIPGGGVLEVAGASTVTGVSRMNTNRGGKISISGTVTLADNASFGAGAGVLGTTGTVTVETGGVLSIGAGGAFTGIGGGDYFPERTQSGNGTLTIAGGTLNVAAPGTASSGAGGLDATKLWMNPYGAGGTASTINLDGGLLSTQREIRDGSGGTTIVNFNGGTLQAAAATAGALLASLDRINFRDGGGTIDTQGFDITCNQTLVHSNIGGDAATDGGLTKIGGGKLTLGGTNTYTGPTVVSEGTLGLTGSFTSDVSVADGATISGTGSTTGSLTLGATTGATIELNAVSLTGVQTGDLTLNGVTNLVISGGSGPFAVATYTGILTDGNGGTLSDSFAVSGARAPLITDTAGLIEISVNSQNLTWTGATSGNWELGGPDANWTSSDNFFFNADEVLFDDSGANKTVTLLDNVTPAYTEVYNTAGNDYTFTGASGIAGATQLVKDGDGTLFIETDNTFSGGTTIYDGTVQVGTGGTTGNLGTGAVINDGTVILNRSDDLTLTNAISGIGSVMKDGPNTVTLGVAQPYSGPTTVAAGVLNLVLNDTFGNHSLSDLDLTIEAGALVTNGAVAAGFTTMQFLTLNGGELRATNTLSAAGGDYQAYGIRETVTVGGGTPSLITDIGQANGAINIGGAVNLGGGVGSSLVLDVADVTASGATDLTVSAKLKNQGGISFSGLTKTGAGTMALTRVNSYTGVTSVEAGVLSLGDGTNNTGLADAADVSVASGAVLDLNYIGTDAIDGLTLGGVPVTPGIWGATGSGAPNIDDTYFTGSGTLTVGTVTGAYGAWAIANGLSGADADPNADIENGGAGDGLDNLLEFAFGTDPNVADNMALTVTDPTTFTPGNVRIEVSFSPLEITLHYVRRKDFAAAGLTYVPEFSDSGGGFIPDPAAPTPVVVSSQDPGDYEVVEVPFLLFDSGGMKADAVLGRVAVTLSP